MTKREKERERERERFNAYTVIAYFEIEIFSI